MNVLIQSVEDPSRRRFVVEQKISEREVIYTDSTEALQSPVAAKIFGFPWTAQVTVGTQFVEVQKQDWVEWEVLEEPLQGLIAEHFQTASGDIEENPKTEPAKSSNLDTPEAQRIAQLIEEQINPALAAHNGFVVLHAIEENKVFLEMGGGCQGCAMSYQTMKEGIEGAIKEVVPQIVEVVDVTNHGAGDNPYFR